MSTYFGLNTDTSASFFTSYSSSSSSSGNSIYDSLGDYSLIQNGEYYKLCKAYYAQDSESSDSSEQEDNDTLVADNAITLKQTSKTLSDMDYSEDNRDSIISSIESFVSDYNDLIDASGSSASSSVSSSTTLLENYTKANQSLLSQVGVTIGSDGTLSVDESTLESASLSDLKTLFSGSGSYNSQVSAYATSLYSEAMMDSVSYNSSGSISTLSTSSLLNIYV